MTAVTSTIPSQGTLTLTGTGLANVDQVIAWPLDPQNYPNFCSIAGESHSATRIDCTFGNISPGSYAVVAFSGECGSSESTVFTVEKPTE